MVLVFIIVAYYKISYELLVSPAPTPTPQKNKTNILCGVFLCDNVELYVKSPFDLLLACCCFCLLIILQYDKVFSCCNESFWMISSISCNCIFVSEMKHMRSEFTYVIPKDKLELNSGACCAKFFILFFYYFS